MPTILIIEDEPAIADNLRYALETEGFDSVHAATAGQGLRHLQEQRVDLIVLDIGLPDQNGLELCREIRKNSNIPILFLTARSSEIDRIVGLEMGADDYVTKPFSPREISARVKAILRRSATKIPTHSPAAPEDFRIDEEKFQIHYGGQALPLSRYEYRLLQVLIDKRGRILSREQLMEFAWDNALSSLDRTVDAHIKTLRAKLKQIRPEESPIETHRGLGYSLKDKK